ncbi:MAG TPA: hypothetical protein GXZ28_05590 [Clostridiales bacterium]|nr:hypothetical protein [Clostridiales bacterium]
MFNLGGPTESGVMSNPGLAMLLMHGTEPTIDERYTDLDGETREALKKHANEFQSEEEIERFISDFNKGKNIM